MTLPSRASALTVSLSLLVGCGDHKSSDAANGGDASDAFGSASGGMGAASSAGGAQGGAGAGAAGSGGSDAGGSMIDGGVCAPSCGGKSCGDDGCGTLCGTCASGSACSSVGTCEPNNCAPGCTVGCPQGCFDLGACMGSAGSGLILLANVYTAGITLSLTSAPTSAEVYYRATGTATWSRGHDGVRIADGRIASSLFALAPATTYEVMVRAGAEVACGSVETLPMDPAHEILQTLHVRAGAAPGGDGSTAAPFATIQAAVAVAAAGTDIVVEPGIYREEVAPSASGSAGRFIRLRGEPGAILDGSDPTIAASGLAWTADGASVWRADFTGNPSYLSRDGERFYHYLSLADLRAGIGNGIVMGEGWFVEAGALYVRSATDPAGYSWQVPRLGTAIFLDGVSHIWVEGFEIRHYGEGAYPKGVDVRDSTDIVIRNNHIHSVSTPVWVRVGSRRVRVEQNRIHQSAVHTWPWNTVKGTDHENSAIVLAGAETAIVADNEIYRIFNGIGSGSFSDSANLGLAFDVDVYRNRIADVADDGLEPEGACINNRFWNNNVDRVLNGVSLAPITYGPVWVLRNRFTDYEESGFKVSNTSAGRVYLYHNTSYTDRADHNGMGVSGYFENIVFRNNIVRGTRYAVEMSLVAGPNDLDYDNFTSPRGVPLIKWDNVRYDTVAAWCAATGLECNGHDADPALTDPANGLFSLGPTSPNVDRGVRLYGINDAYAGAAPDIGYVEVGQSETPPLP